jgi:hypothetical protein
MSNTDFEIRGGAVKGFSTALVEEILGEGHGFARGPERDLLAALLFDGVQAFVNYALAETPTAKARYVEAFNWVMDKDSDEPFSFNGACEALGVSAEYLRFGLANATTSLLQEVGKSRRNF